MSEVDRQGSDPDLTFDDSQPGKYVPYEKIDRAKYDIIHPENAMSRLKMTARTAYRQIDKGELAYTLERGSKRIVVRKDNPMSDPSVGNVSQYSDADRRLTEKVSDRSVMSPTVEAILEKIPDYQRMLVERDEEIRELRQERDDLIERQRQDLDAARADVERVRQECQTVIDDLKSQLETERVKNARIDGELKNIERVVETKDQVLGTQAEAISSQKTTIEALNNERIVITQQLQKYRSQEDVITPGGNGQDKRKSGGLFGWFK